MNQWKWMVVWSLFLASFATESQAFRLNVRYGRWCGQSGSGRPIDRLDEACQAHDQCRARHPDKRWKHKGQWIGYCGCDAALLQTLQSRHFRARLKAQYKKNPAQSLKAERAYRSILSAYRRAPCVRRVKRACSMATHHNRPKHKAKKLKRRPKKQCKKVPVITAGSQ